MRLTAARLRYFLDDAWDECCHSPGANLLAAASLSAALFVAGLVLLVLFNVRASVSRVRGDLRVDVYLVDEIEDEAREALQTRLGRVGGVARVQFVDKETALRRFRESFGDLGELPRELGSNPLPASLEVFLQPRPEAGALAQAIIAEANGQPGVEEVRFDQFWLDRLDALMELARWGGAGLAVLVFASVTVIMASVLRLAVHARRDEIEIMLLVGASPWFVRGPFLVAGIVQGLVASSVAALSVELMRRIALVYAGPGGLTLVELVASRPLPLGLVGLMAGIGLAVGAAGASFAVRRPAVASYQSKTM